MQGSRLTWTPMRRESRPGKMRHPWRQPNVQVRIGQCQTFCVLQSSAFMQHRAPIQEMPILVVRHKVFPYLKTAARVQNGSFYERNCGCSVCSLLPRYTLAVCKLLGSPSSAPKGSLSICPQRTQRSTSCVLSTLKVHSYLSMACPVANVIHTLHLKASRGRQGSKPT